MPRACLNELQLPFLPQMLIHDNMDTTTETSPRIKQMTPALLIPKVDSITVGMPADCPRTTKKPTIDNNMENKSIDNINNP